MFNSPCVGKVSVPEIEINSISLTLPIVLKTGPGVVNTYGTGINIAKPSKIKSVQVKLGLNLNRISWAHPWLVAAKNL
jgi:hypothetical protein